MEVHGQGRSCVCGRVGAHGCVGQEVCAERLQISYRIHPTRRLWAPLFLQRLSDRKSHHEFVYSAKPFGAQHHPRLVRRLAMAQPICQQPIYSGHSFVGELDDGCVCLAGGGRVTAS